MSNRSRTTVPRYPDPDYMPWVSKTLAQREIKKINRKIRSLSRDLEKCQDLRKKHLEFEYSFRKFLVRFEGRKWSSEWPLERFQEALIHLKEILP